MLEVVILAIRFDREAEHLDFSERTIVESVKIILAAVSKGN